MTQGIISSNLDRLEARLGVSRSQIAQACQQWQITELAVFGSVLRDDFRPESDIDLLVTFAPGFRRGLAETLQIHETFQRLLGREVDVIVKKALERSPNIPRRDRILKSAEVICVA